MEVYVLTGEETQPESRVAIGNLDYVTQKSLDPFPLPYILPASQVVVTIKMT